MSPDCILKGVGCPHCFSRRIPKKQEVYEKEIYDKYGDEWSIVSSYTGSRMPIQIRHNPCGATRTYANARFPLVYQIKCKNCRELGKD